MAFHTPGGGEMQLLAYKKYLPDLGVDVSLLDPWNPKFLDHDVVHFFSCVGGSSHFCGFVKSIGKPLVVSSSLWITQETKTLYPYDEINLQLHLADTVVANSRIECLKLSEVFSLPLEKLKTVYNGVDEDAFKDSDGTLFSKANKLTRPYVLNVANIEPRKNQLSLIRAMRSMPSHDVVLVGGIRDHAYAVQVFEEGGDKVRYCGWIEPGPMLRSAFRGCSAFCLPSTLETPGLAALEAAAQGVPIVVTEVGSTREYFKETCTYVSPDSAESIASGTAAAINTTRHSTQSRLDKSYLWSNTLKDLVEVYYQHI